MYARRAARDGETRFKILTAALFYRVIGRITAVHIPQDTGDFRLLDRRVVDTLVTMREQHRFMRGLSAWVGFRQEAVPYHRQERFAGTTKYPLSPPAPRAIVPLAPKPIMPPVVKRPEAPNPPAPKLAP